MNHLGVVFGISGGDGEQEEEEMKEKSDECEESAVRLFFPSHLSFHPKVHKNPTRGEKGSRTRVRNEGSRQDTQDPKTCSMQKSDDRRDESMSQRQLTITTLCGHFFAPPEARAAKDRQQQESLPLKSPAGDHRHHNVLPSFRCDPVLPLPSSCLSSYSG